MIRASIPGHERPLLAAGERCPSGYLGLDMRALARSDGPTTFVELVLRPQGPGRLGFSASLETVDDTPTGGTSRQERRAAPAPKGP